MSFKRFRSQDLVYTTLKTHPEYNFIVDRLDGNDRLFFQKERVRVGEASGNFIKHVPTGSVSLYELNIDRKTANEDRDSNFISASMPPRDSNGSRIRPNSMSQQERINLGSPDMIHVAYPLSASITRIYAPEDDTIKQFGTTGRLDPNRNDGNQYTPSPNRKYITALKNIIDNPDTLQRGNFDENFKLNETNIICIPGILYGSQIKKGSIKLDYYIDGISVATAEDKEGDLICTHGPNSVKDTKVGVVVYNQGLLLLNSNTSLHESHTDYYYNNKTLAAPSWINFGTGIPMIGENTIHPALERDTAAYSINFKGTNKVPSLTMFAFSEKGEHNFSNNPTFLERKNYEGQPEEHPGGEDILEDYVLTTSSFAEPSKNIKKINKSVYQDESADFIATTYISKVGIYDKDKNLIAVATLANPIKKTKKRDFMIKMKLDF